MSEDSFDNRDKTALIVDLANKALLDFALQPSEAPARLAHDAGPAVLAGLIGSNPDWDSHHIAERALSAWLNRFECASRHVGLFGGLAGVFAGSRCASTISHVLRPFADGLRKRLVGATREGLWRSPVVDWHDYDLVSGPAGVVLSLTTDAECEFGDLKPFVTHLGSLCDGPRLERLRVHAYRGDPQREWNFGRINTGLAHGVGGIAAALRAACEVGTADELAFLGLQRASRWLVGESFTDARGLRTWSPAAREGGTAPKGWTSRQAWCYGTPGLAWTLWECGRVLGASDMQTFAQTTMLSFCAVFDEAVYIDSGALDDALAVCHGAAGTLIIADAFARYANLHEADALAQRLEDFLLERMSDIALLAKQNMTLLSGASGILCVLLARAGSSRDWLRQLGLR